MLTQLLFPDLRGVGVERISWAGNVLRVGTATFGRIARRPLWGRCTRQVRGWYDRMLADLSCGGAPTILHLRARCFACRVQWCR
jgi:hypothetical protein